MLLDFFTDLHPLESLGNTFYLPRVNTFFFGSTERINIYSSAPDFSIKSLIECYQPNGFDNILMSEEKTLIEGHNYFLEITKNTNGEIEKVELPVVKQENSTNIILPENSEEIPEKLKKISDNINKVNTDIEKSKEYIKELQNKKLGIEQVKSVLNVINNRHKSSLDSNFLGILNKLQENYVNSRLHTKGTYTSVYQPFEEFRYKINLVRESLLTNSSASGAKTTLELITYSNIDSEFKQLLLKYKLRAYINMTNSLSEKESILCKAIMQKLDINREQLLQASLEKRLAHYTNFIAFFELNVSKAGTTGNALIPEVQVFKSDIKSMSLCNKIFLSEYKKLSESESESMSIQTSLNKEVDDMYEFLDDNVKILNEKKEIFGEKKLIIKDIVIDNELKTSLDQELKNYENQESNELMKIESKENELINYKKEALKEIFQENKENIKDSKISIKLNENIKTDGFFTRCFNKLSTFKFW